MARESEAVESQIAGEQVLPLVYRYLVNRRRRVPPILMVGAASLRMSSSYDVTVFAHSMSFPTAIRKATS